MRVAFVDPQQFLGCVDLEGFFGRVGIPGGGAQGGFDQAGVVDRTGRPVGIALTGDTPAYYVLYLPAEYDGAGPVDVVVALSDPSGGQSGGLSVWTADLADRTGTAVVTMAPDGVTWAFARTRSEAAALDPLTPVDGLPWGSVDVDRLTSVLDDVSERITVGRVLAVGQNDGGLMATRLACDLAERISESFDVT